VRPRIGIFAHAGNQNLGDEALVAAAIQAVRHRYPDAEIRGYSANPADTGARHGIAAFPIRRVPATITAPVANGTLPAHQRRGWIAGIARIVKAVPPFRAGVAALRRTVRVLASALREPRFLLASHRNLKGVDLLLIAGSQQLNDMFGGAWGFPYTVWKWSMLAKLTGTRVAFLSVGAGPIRSPLSRWFLRRGLALASYRSHRDPLSCQLLRSIGVPGDGLVAPDLVYGLRLAAPAIARDPLGPPIVGANPVPFFDGRYWPQARPATYGRYVGTLAAFADWLLESGHRVLFFPTQLSADPPVIDDVRRRMATNGNLARTAMLPPGTIASLEDLVAEIARMDFVVANRYHGILIALLLQKPVLGLAYHAKSVELMSMMGLEKYAIDLTDCTTARLIAAFASLEANAHAIREQIATHLDSLRERLERQYDGVFGLMDQFRAAV
jgi:polysaccharide pyruvyl transferase WcaK-like protein